MEVRRVPAQLIAAAFVVACGGGDAPPVPSSVDAWARGLIARPVSEVCVANQVADFESRWFCFVRPELVSADVAALGAHMVTLQRTRDEGRYIDLDWGGGHIEANGVIIGPARWTHAPDAERKEKRIRDGVFRYDTRQ